jgi:hypothetical protein
MHLTKIRSIESDPGSVLRIRECISLLEVGMGRGKLAELVEGGTHCIVGHDAARHLWGAVRQAEDLLSEGTILLQLSPGMINPPQPHEH